jgi:hypothetical protein
MTQRGDPDPPLSHSTAASRAGSYPRPPAPGRSEGDEDSGYEPAAGRIRLVLIDEAGTVPEYKLPLLAALGARSEPR